MPKDNTTRYILLGLLSHEPLSGYDLKRRIDIGIRQFWNVGYAQIYPTLAQLESDGFVTKSTQSSEKGPSKNIYAITESGRELLQNWLLLPEEKEYAKYEILLKLFFGAGLPVQTSIARIHAFEKRHRQNLDLLESMKENLENVLDESNDHLYFYLTVLFGEQVYTAYLNWAEQALALLCRQGKTSAEIARKEEPQ